MYAISPTSNFFQKRPRLFDYATMKAEVRELVDYTIANHLAPNPVIRMRFGTRKPKVDSLWMLSWSDLIELRKALAENQLADLFKILYGISEKRLAQLDLFNCFAAYHWAINELKQIHDAEIERLQDDPSDDEKEAGVEELYEYGHYPALDNLAKGNALVYDNWLRLPYAVVFQKLAKDKLIADINEKYHAIISRKNQKPS